MKNLLFALITFHLSLGICAQSKKIIPGEVVEVYGNEVVIDHGGNFIPVVGDSVSIGFEIDGEFIPYDASWVVMEANLRSIHALNTRFDDIEPEIGYSARIHSENPRQPSYADLISEDWKVDLIPEVTTLNASIKKLRFFSSGKGSTPLEKRSYSKYFPASETHYINWELNLKHPMPGKRIDFKLLVKYYYYDGELISESVKESYINSNWKGSFHTSGWGSQTDNWWKKGKYYVQVYNNHALVYQEPFFVY